MSFDSLRIAVQSIVYMIVIDMGIANDIQRSEGHCYNLHQCKSGIDFISDHEIFFHTVDLSSGLN